jgi:hypothetical protein
LLGLQGVGIQALLKMMAHQQAAQMIGVLTDVTLEGLKFFRVRDQLRYLLHLMQVVENLLYGLGVIGMLADQTRVTRHLDAPFSLHGFWSIIDDSGFVVSSVLPSAQILLSFHMATWKMGMRPSLYVMGPNDSAPCVGYALALPRHQPSVVLWLYQ